MDANFQGTERGEDLVDTENDVSACSHIRSCHTLCVWVFQKGECGKLKVQRTSQVGDEI